MKKILFASLAFLGLGAAAQEKNNEVIEGNGKMISREVNVSSFDALKASGVYELRLSQGSKESVRIEADENLQEYFNVRNEGHQLVIDMEKLKNKNLKSKNKMKVYITFKNLKEMELKTVGNVNSDQQLSFDNLELNNKSVGHIELNMNVNKLDLQNKSVGNVKLSGKAQEAMVKNNGVGTIHAGDFVVQNMNIENNGVGSAEVNAEASLKVKDSFLGKVQNRGKAQMKRINRVRV